MTKLKKEKEKQWLALFFSSFHKKKYFSEIDHVLENGVHVTFDEKQWFSTYIGGPKIMNLKQENVVNRKAYL